MGLDDHHFHGDRRAQQINHLLVSQRSDSHLADLHQSAALPQPCLPGEAEGLHVGHDALEVDMKAKLAKAVPAQSHFWRLTASGGDLELKRSRSLTLEKESWLRRSASRHFRKHWEERDTGNFLN